MNTDTETDFESLSSCTDDMCHGHTVPEDVLEEIEENLLLEIDDYVKSNIESYSSPEFHDHVITDITTAIWDATINSNLCVNTDSNRAMVAELIKDAANRFFFETGIFPPRSYPTVGSKPPQTPDSIGTTICALKAVEQPDQRTPEWYSFRNNLITASNIYKALSTESQQNSLIFEKCKGIPTDPAADVITPTGTVASPLYGARGWGQLCEPISAMIYEATYPGNQLDTTFGCIRHPTYSFIGASPDGVVVDGPRRGHLVEIKNTVSREIGDVPIESHWIQCQVQMEVCDLPYCDYIQTVIKQISREEFDYVTAEYRGAILLLKYEPRGYRPLNQFTPSPNDSSHYKYVYMPLGLAESGDDAENETILQTWMQQVMQEHAEYLMVEVIYWKMEDMSCVVIPRNREWFLAVLPKFQSIWEKVEDGRKNGFQQYAPKKRTAAPNDALIRSFQVSLLQQEPDSTSPSQDETI